jgi:hypothetical protein
MTVVAALAAARSGPFAGAERSGGGRRAQGARLPQMSGAGSCLSRRGDSRTRPSGASLRIIMTVSYTVTDRQMALARLLEERGFN